MRVFVLWYYVVMLHALILVPAGENVFHGFRRLRQYMVNVYT